MSFEVSDKELLEINRVHGSDDELLKLYCLFMTCAQGSTNPEDVTHISKAYIQEKILKMLRGHGVYLDKDGCKLFLYLKNKYCCEKYSWTSLPSGPLTKERENELQQILRTD